ncbi:MAG: hypothetical protein WCR53_07660 [Bacteroidaceae bacterium]|jgi:hypothetical protein|nr:hypothetical protein [Bacteroidaceae bacterium]
MTDSKEIGNVIEGGLVFKKTSPDSPNKGKKIKTKAKKKGYITGLHGSGSAKKKAMIRERRANRHKNK